MFSLHHSRVSESEKNYIEFVFYDLFMSLYSGPAFMMHCLNNNNLVLFELHIKLTFMSFTYLKGHQTLGYSISWIRYAEGSLIQTCNI